MLYCHHRKYSIAECNFYRDLFEDHIQIMSYFSSTEYEKLSFKLKSKKNVLSSRAFGGQYMSLDSNSNGGVH